MFRASTRVAVLTSMVAALAGCGGGGGGGSDGGGSGPCGLVGEPQNNHSRDTAAALTLGTAITGCLAKGTENDWYEFTVPSDPAGGYVKVEYTNVGAFSVFSEFYNAADNGMIGQEYADNDGQNLTLWFSVAPGNKYRVNTHSFISTSSDQKYTMKASYTKVDDTFEPNDTQATAKPLTLGTPVNAYMFTGYKGGSIGEAEYADWYSVTLAGTTINASIENVPTDVEIYMELFDAGGTSILYEIGANPGANKTLTKTGLTAGTYSLLLKPFAPNSSMSYGKGATPPDHFTRAYKLTVGP